MIVLASVAMGAVVLVLSNVMADTLASSSLLTRLIATFGVIGVAALVYFAIVIVTGAVDRNELIGALRRRKK